MRKTVACGESVIDTLVENIIDIGAYLKRKLFITLKTVYQKIGGEEIRKRVNVIVLSV